MTAMYQHLSTHKAYKDAPELFQSQVKKSLFHLDIYISAEILPQISPVFKLDGTILNDIPYGYHEDYIKEIRRIKPSTKHLVQRLYMLGFRQDFIANMLNQSQQNVSYHLNSKVKRMYFNPFLTDIPAEKYLSLYTNSVIQQS